MDPADSLQARFSELKQMITKARKEGADLKIEQMMLIPLPAKIELVKTLGEKRDYESALGALNEAKTAVIARIETFKKENHQNLTQKGALAQFGSKEKNLRALLKQGRTIAASQEYAELRQMFQKLDRASRSEVYPDLIAIISLFRHSVRKG